MVDVMTRQSHPLPPAVLVPFLRQLKQGEMHSCLTAELWCPSSFSVPSLHVVQPREEIKAYTLKHSHSLFLGVRYYGSITNE